MGYKSITNEIGERVPHTTIRGLRLAIKNRELGDGRYTATFRNGTSQLFEIISSSAGKDKKLVTRVKAHYIQTKV